MQTLQRHDQQQKDILSTRQDFLSSVSAFRIFLAIPLSSCLLPARHVDLLERTHLVRQNQYRRQLLVVHLPLLIGTAAAERMLPSTSRRAMVESLGEMLLR